MYMSVTFIASSIWLRAEWTVYLSMPTLLTAKVAHECLALYNADIFVEIDAIKIIDNNEYQ